MFPDAAALKIPSFGTWMHYAAAFGNVEIVKYLMVSGLDINSSENRDGRMPLDYASSNNNIEVVKYIIDQGCKFDTSTSVRNPLFAAIIGGSEKIVSMLLAAGIDTSKRYVIGSEYNQPLDAVAFAMLQGQRGIARLIALRNSSGDEVIAEAIMLEGLNLAIAITTKSNQ
ncbi:hypothetical protein ABAC402_10970 [Asticcacaulis sp. AC402]|nr:hypothetical protein ABAC402_10970 [Asticcacaulis sp. AC402]